MPILYRKTEVHFLPPSSEVNVPPAVASYVGIVSTIAATFCTLIVAQFTNSSFLWVVTFIAAGLVTELLLGSRLGKVAAAALLLTGLAWGVYIIGHVPVHQVPPHTIAI